MIRICVLIAATNGLISMVMGAFGAHMLKLSVTPSQYDFFTSASNYQLWYSVCTVAIFGLIRTNISPSVENFLKSTCWLFQVGIILFSGGIYISILTDIKLLSFVIPTGGVALMLGWIVFILATLRKSERASK
ncbi:MAG: hypothetical protein COV35_00725 [Alphaproteobacteria bacterium CG11_big_fil_rev_8_21_14_0_20_39_49]|nr:MAG: hypothetical protein COV35_00725 [Alphaproteobacteria bacterium CG11_big_fil_rev_8_21_14_0_20_39_49]